jgi:pimeloyl-ACP methyl ester carboxylesterase
MKRAAAVLFLALAAGVGAVDAAPPRLNAHCSTAADRRAAVAFRATDGARLVGVLLGPARSRAGVVISHESDGGLCNWLPYGRRLARLGYRVLVYDSRGYGSSPLPRRRVERFELDVAGAVRELRRRGMRRVVVAGGSMGAMSSLVAAATIRPRVDGVVAVSPASWRFRGLDPLRAAPRLSAPVLYIAAEEDGQFASDARTLHAATGSADKQLVVVEGRGHGFELVTGAERAGIRESIETFLRGHTRTAARRTTAAVPGAESDVRLLERELERIHPNPFHATSRENFRRHFDQLAARAASLERDQLIVELMRTMALLGERDGHSGLYTLGTRIRSHSTSTPCASTGSRTGSRPSAAPTPVRSSSRSRAFPSTSSSRRSGP